MLHALPYLLFSVGVLLLWLLPPQARLFHLPPWAYALLAVVAAALATGWLGPLGLLPLGVLAYAATLAERPRLTPWLRTSAIGVAIGLSLGLGLHMFPGFSHRLFLGPGQFSADATVYVNWLSLDKPLVGLILLGSAGLFARSREAWRLLLGAGLPWTVAVIASVLVLAMLLQVVAPEPKWTPVFWLWAWANLFTTVLTEEAFFRGFVQRHLRRALGYWHYGPLASVVVAGLLFGIAHIGGGVKYAALAAVAGIGYGWLYERTGRIEMSIIAHFLLNTVHFLLFSYPMLAGV